MESDSQLSWKETIVRASRPVRLAATLALVMLALFLLVATIDGLHNWGQATTLPPNTITVTGEGTATAIPDTATISFGETVTAPDVATAETKMTATMNTALQAIEALGVSKDDITTTSYSVSQHYVATTPVCPPGAMCPAIAMVGMAGMTGGSTAAGYDVSEMVNVKINIASSTSTSLVSQVLGILAKDNITNVSGPDYIVGDTQMVLEQARAQAIQKAQADAQNLASTLGVKLGKITDFEDNTSSGGPTPLFEAATANAANSSASKNPSVPTGTNIYTDDVSITYQIP